MNNFIIKSSEKKDNERLGYFNNNRLGIVKCNSNEVPYFITKINHEEQSEIQYFRLNRCDSSGNVIETIELDVDAIKYNDNFYFLDKNYDLNLRLKECLYYLEFADEYESWVSQYFEIGQNMNPIFEISDNGTYFRQVINEVFTLKKIITRLDKFEGAETCYITIDWGDGVIEHVSYDIDYESYLDVNIEHTYTTQGDYTILISNDVLSNDNVEILSDYITTNISLTDNSNKTLSVLRSTFDECIDAESADGIDSSYNNEYSVQVTDIDQDFYLKRSVFNADIEFSGVLISASIYLNAVYDADSMSTYVFEHDFDGSISLDDFSKFGDKLTECSVYDGIKFHKFNINSLGIEKLKEKGVQYFMIRNDFDVERKDATGVDNNLRFDRLDSYIELKLL